MKGKGLGRLLIVAGVLLFGLMLVGPLVGRAFGARWHQNWQPRSGYQQGFDPRQGGPGFEQGFDPRQGGPGFGPQQSFDPRQGGPQQGFDPRQGGPGFGPQQGFDPRQGGPGFGERGERGWHGFGHGKHHGGMGFFFPLFWVGALTKLALFGLVGALIWRTLQLRRRDNGTPPSNDPSVV